VGAAEVMDREDNSMPAATRVRSPPRRCEKGADYVFSPKDNQLRDVAFREDDSRVRVGNAPENLALVRKPTQNLLQQEAPLKRGIY
jgi:hypothetical protein